MPDLQKIRFSVPRNFPELIDRLNRAFQVWHSQLTADPPIVTTPTAGVNALPTVNGSALTFGTHQNQLTSWAGLAAGAGITIGPNDSGKYVLISAAANYDKASSASPFTIPVFGGWLFLDANASAGADFVANLPIATGSQNIVVVKKMDANAHNIAITPNGTDTIDDVNAAYTISTRYGSVSLRDAVLGKWRLF